MLRGTEIVSIKFVLKFFKIKNPFCGLCFYAIAKDLPLELQFYKC